MHYSANLVSVSNYSTSAWCGWGWTVSRTVACIGPSAHLGPSTHQNNKFYLMHGCAVLLLLAVVH